ncbi:Bgt-50725 [Blumeria graminis f. sp. tritici]|uniref:Bgt-50725 n=2 Tax=Blumeria graminis TaxID=34373 RepID=A0A9X9L8S4_BLUGR|nr:Bgt-50725 [Blumeria graminis f. sp. tritici]
MSSRTASSYRQLTAPHSNSRDRQLGGADRKPLHSGMPPASSSLHPIINGSKPHKLSVDRLLCINCADFGHRRRDCHNKSLTHLEQAYLKEIVFGLISFQSAQSYFY